MKPDAFRGQVVIAPGFVDWLAIKVFLEPAIRRAKAAQAKMGG